ncbi:unnamed protein product, partial [Effrenium voratum]
MTTVTDPALAAILQRRRLLSEPQLQATSWSEHDDAAFCKASVVRPGIVQEALAAIKERAPLPKPESTVQCFAMDTDSESEGSDGSAEEICTAPVQSSGSTWAGDEEPGSSSERERSASRQAELRAAQLLKPLTWHSTAAQLRAAAQHQLDLPDLTLLCRHGDGFTPLRDGETLGAVFGAVEELVLHPGRLLLVDHEASNRCSAHGARHGSSRPGLSELEEENAQLRAQLRAMEQRLAEAESRPKVVSDMREVVLDVTDSSAAGPEAEVRSEPGEPICVAADATGEAEDQSAQPTGPNAQVAKPDQDEAASLLSWFETLVLAEAEATAPEPWQPPEEKPEAIQRTASEKPLPGEVDTCTTEPHEPKLSPEPTLSPELQPSPELPSPESKPSAKPSPELKPSPKLPSPEVKPSPEPKLIPEAKLSPELQPSPELKPSSGLSPEAKPSPEPKLIPEAKLSPELQPSPEAKLSPELKPSPGLPSPEAKPSPEPKLIPEANLSPELKQSSEAKPSPELKPSPKLPSPEAKPSPEPKLIPEAKPSPEMPSPEAKLSPELKPSPEAKLSPEPKPSPDPKQIKVKAAEAALTAQEPTKKEAALPAAPVRKGAPLCVSLLSMQSPDQPAMKVNMTSKATIADLRAEVMRTFDMDDRMARRLRFLRKRNSCYVSFKETEFVREKIFLHDPDIRALSGLKLRSLPHAGGSSPAELVGEHSLPAGVDGVMQDFILRTFSRMSEEELSAWNALPKFVIWTIWFDIMSSPLFRQCLETSSRDSIFGSNFERKASIRMAKEDGVLREYAFHKRQLISVWFHDEVEDAAGNSVKEPPSDVPEALPAGTPAAEAKA